jgi:glucose-6-phosphate-specific signal transduction histidine kinase
MAISQSTRELISDHKVLTGFNRFIYFALVAIAINIADSFYGPYKDYTAIYILSATIPVLIISLVLHKKNYRLSAKSISAIAFNVVFLLITMHIGQRGGTYLYYFPFILCYIYLFRAEGNRKYVWTFTTISLCFLVYTLIAAPDEPPVFKVSDAKMKQIFLLTFCISFVLTVYFFYLIYSYQENLYTRLLGLEKNNKRQLLRSVIETQETSIENIVNELRNNINQTLVASKFFLEKASEEENNQPLISKSYGLTNDAIEALTRLCIKLHPAVIADIGFIEGTREYIHVLKKINHSQIQFHCTDSGIEEMTAKDKISVFRIIQNYLMIVLKNPGSSQVNIEVNYQRPIIRIIFSQNDPGFNFMKAGHPFDLDDIHSRITYFNGTIRQNSQDKFETSIVELSLN